LIAVEIDPRNTILFVGAGVSMALGLPSWQALIDEIGRKLGFDPRIFATYGTALSLAEYYKIETGSIGPLRSWMDTEWHSKDIDIDKSGMEEAIVMAGLRKIYTTNFDRWLEKSCDHWGVSYRKVSRVSDIPAVRDGELEIVKFHGDFEDDDSLVLTESSYLDRLNFESPLDLVLRADSLKYGMLFVGYSLADTNVRYLFHKLADLWSRVPKKVPRPKSYIFMMHPNPIDEAIFERWGITAIQNKSDIALDGLPSFLNDIAARTSKPAS